MSSDESADEPPSVELGTDDLIEGAPIARIAARLSWPLEKSEIERKEGETEIRTPTGPTPLSVLLSDVETTYFARRQDFVNALERAIGKGPISP